MFINASEQYQPEKDRILLGENHIDKIVDTYQLRPEHIERYARRVPIEEIEKNAYNLNISKVCKHC